MKTVDKAMTVLAQFSTDRTELGLTELARLADLDKAATRRLLVALIKHGYIEQSTATRGYRLGPGFLALARVREATVPLKRAAQETTDWLTRTVDETAHISVPLPEHMATLAYSLPSRGNIINIVPSQPLPFHATASGIAYLAAGDAARLDAALRGRRTRITPHTPTSKAATRAAVNTAKSCGYAHCQSTFELGVSSFAMAFFAGDTTPAGTVSVALPEHRLDEARRNPLLTALRDAVERIECALTGQRSPVSRA
ncbi:MAG: IclR family transcriptional regulator [Pseudomonadota bacterium]